MNSEYHANFDDVQAVAGKSLDRKAQRSLFDRLDWFRKLHQFCLPDARAVVIHAAAKEAAAWLFLKEEAAGRLSAYANWYNFTFRPIFVEGIADGSQELLLRNIAQKAKNHSHSIDIEPLSNEDGAADITALAFRKAGWIVFKSKADDNHILDVKGRNFEQYWADRPGRLRNTVRRKAKKNVVSIRIETEFSDAHWNDYCEVYEKSWKPEEGNPGFLKDLAETEAKAGCLRLGLAYIDGKPVAAQFWTVENGEALIHKLAHVEDATKASPGTLLSVALFAHVIDIDKVDLIDFGTGNDPYKKEWMEDVRDRYRLDMYRPTALAAWPAILKHHVLHLAGRRQSL